MLKTQAPSRPKGIEDLLSNELIAKLENLDLSSKRVFFGKLKGERRSKKRGQSVEFADHRQYVSGDDIRHIDWNIYARLDHLFLKLFLEEEDLSLSVVIDASASSDCGEPSKFLFMQKAAMAMGYVGLVNLNRVSCTAMGAAEGSVAGALRDLRGRRRTHDLARFLCTLEPAGSFSFKEACERIALTRRGKGVMLVFSDFFFKEGYEDGLRRLVGHGYDVFCIQVLSPQELEPPVTGDLRLKDVEDADLAEVTISAPLMKRYKANLAAYCQEINAFCLRRDMQMLTVRSDTPIDVLILDYLRKRGVVK
ncbi:MAG TPA: DUF58 domain-containing protein [Phycisphaerales bacterium]|nr:DUF58 domain-containing protein [Phycisphaerales bacterium]